MAKEIEAQTTAYVENAQNVVFGYAMVNSKKTAKYILDNKELYSAEEVEHARTILS